MFYSTCKNADTTENDYDNLTDELQVEITCNCKC